MNLCNIRRTFVELRPKRKWKVIYWLIDVHGVIIPGSFHKKNDFRFIAPECKEVLRWLSDREDQKLILWTSSYDSELMELTTWLGTQGIIIDSINQNVWEKNTEYADFTKKCYFNILLDDKSGLDPTIDWLLIAKELENITGDKILEWSREQKNRMKIGLRNIKKELDNLVSF